MSQLVRSNWNLFMWLHVIHSLRVRYLEMRGLDMLYVLWKGNRLMIRRVLSSRRRFIVLFLVGMPLYVRLFILQRVLLIIRPSWLGIVNLNRGSLSCCFQIKKLNINVNHCQRFLKESHSLFKVNPLFTDYLHYQTHRY